jgi:hypothetical protein
MIPQQNLHAALANILPAHGGSVQNVIYFSFEYIS